MIGVQVGEDLGNLAAQHAQQRQLRHLQHGDLHASRTGGGRGLQTDPAGTDHHDARCRLERSLDAVAVSEPAQVEHSVEIRSGHGQATR